MSEVNGNATAMTADDVAKRAGVTPATLRRWVKAGAIPQYDGEWTPAASAHARIVAKLRQAGEPLESIVAAAADGRLALGGVDQIFQSETDTYTLKEVSKLTGLKRDLIERVWVAMGFPIESINSISEPDLEALRHIKAVIDGGLPEEAFLQIVRVWAKAFADITDAETRLIRMYVHEPLLRSGASGDEITAAMSRLATESMTHIGPMLEFIHNRYLQQFAERSQMQNVQGERLQSDKSGQIEVSACFVDMAGFTRFTEEQGVDKAFAEVERLRSEVENTLPTTARLIKMIGDGVMVVSSDPSDLLTWAVGLVGRKQSKPKLRVGIHTGQALYRDGDYYGSTPNMAARVLNRADGGEVVVTSEMRDQSRAKTPGLRFVSIGRVRMKGFNEPVELFRVESRLK
ncbi:MAG: hypothetical protein JHC87_01480 [Thermoleophilaceae bacterium]|nr:hypothetical protein [Thermoleophilaceae bacterium]